MPQLFADIVIDISHEAIDRVFQYRVPIEIEEKIDIGMQVIIPFGQGNNERKGYVVGLSNCPNYDVNKIKYIISIDEHAVAIESQLIKLAAWIRQQYGSTMINALRTVILVKQKVNQKKKKYISLSEDEKKVSEYLLECTKDKRKTSRVRLIKELQDQKELEYTLITEKLGVSSSVINTLEKDKIINVSSFDIYRNPVKQARIINNNICLNGEQKVAVDTIVADLDSNIQKTYLLHGITGSGKTQVYLDVIEHVINMNKQAILLIPEIALTYQTVKRFQNRFGDRVTIINSKLSKGERYDQFLRAKKGEVDVVIGPRSALFTPFLNLGIIIIDEEHEATYKSENPPKYHAREVAIMRAKMAGASVVLGSATPSIETYANAITGKFKLLELTARAKNSQLSNVSVVDMREELKSGNYSMFSVKLKELVKDRLSKGQQIMLFINRRGYASFVSCRKCGHVIKCPHCDVSLTYHSDGMLKCHYCGYEKRFTRICPECGSKYIGTFGTGTQKVEEAIIKEFPSARILRMDLDTTKGKNGHEDILSAFANNEADILIGTQMIVKGHDFENVTLVGIIAADLSLHSSDFRASERTFNLLTQASGRAGRGNLPGEVVIQTYDPSHYSIISASRQDYIGFFEQEIEYRRLLKYPPIYQMLVIFISSKYEKTAIISSKNICNFIRNEFSKTEDVSIIGPSEGNFSKLNDIYRQVIYIKHMDNMVLINIKDTVEKCIDNNEDFRNCAIQFDFNPMTTY